MRHGYVVTPCVTRGSEKTPGVCPRALLPAAPSRNRYGPWLGDPSISSCLPLRAAGPTPPFSRPNTEPVENRRQLSWPGLPRLPFLPRRAEPEVEKPPRFLLEGEHHQGFCATTKIDGEHVHPADAMLYDEPVRSPGFLATAHRCLPPPPDENLPEGADYFRGSPPDLLWRESSKSSSRECPNSRSFTERQPSLNTMLPDC